MKIIRQQLFDPLDQVTEKIATAIYKKYHTLKRESHIVKIPKKNIIAIIKVSFKDFEVNNLKEFFRINNSICKNLFIKVVLINQKSVVFEISKTCIEHINNSNSRYLMFNKEEIMKIRSRTEFVELVISKKTLR